MAEGFNDFFCSICQSLANDIPFSASYCNRSPCLNTILLLPVTECYNIISKLKLTKTSSDQIPVSLFVKIQNLLSSHLIKLINFSIETGYFPTHLKVASLTPICKSGEASDPTNYRPIALPFLSKIVERVIAIRLNYFLVKNYIL